MVRLFTTFYREPRRERLAEYVECLNHNLACRAIDEVCVLVEGPEDILPASGKLHTRQAPQRPVYDDFFRWIDEAAGEDDISVIANADIWFDGSLAVASRALRVRDCFAMARWEGSRLFDRNDSQDCWIFRGRVNGARGDFPIGVPRCDNRLLYELQTAGYRVSNPAFSIRARHLHSGERGEYTHEGLVNFVAEPYRYLWPHNLWSLPRTLLHNALHPAEQIGWRLDRRRVERMLPFRAIGRIRRLASGMIVGDGAGTTRR
jgi:hypothetical protein